MHNGPMKKMHVSLESFRDMRELKSYGDIDLYWWCLCHVSCGVCFVALDSCDLLLSYILMPPASHVTDVLISTLKHAYL